MTVLPMSKVGDMGVAPECLHAYQLNLIKPEPCKPPNETSANLPQSIM